MQHRFFASIVWQDVYEKKVGGCLAPRPLPYPSLGAGLCTRLCLQSPAGRSWVRMAPGAGCPAGVWGHQLPHALPSLQA